MGTDDFSEWFRRKRFLPFRSWIFGDVDEMIEEMEEIFEKEFNKLQQNIPKELERERTLSDGSKIREWGPFVYGYSVKINPDGKPEITEFGNMEPSLEIGSSGSRKPTLNFKEIREPFVDVFSTNGEIKIIVELPGVEKSDIKLDATEQNLTISVVTPHRKYYKKIQLHEKVKPDDSKSSYNNGILEVIMPKVKKSKSKGVPVKID
ncbi:MAG: Hsp20/alpha crystallin family protein [Nitrososphaeraceae archaeon]|nr:Hsp20/alpha crystallin family protein [Nitrososphaeraceae archaeon]